MADVDPGLFQEFLNWKNQVSNNMSTGAERFSRAYNIASADPGKADRLGLAGRLGGYQGSAAMTGLGSGLISALSGGSLPEIIGSGTGTAIADKIAQPIAASLSKISPKYGGLLAAATKVAAPLIGGVIGEKTAGGLANALAPQVNAAQQAAGSTINNAINPNSSTNTADKALEEQLAVFNKLKESLGEYNAMALMLSKGYGEQQKDLDLSRFNLAMRRAPVQAAYEGGLKLIDGANEVNRQLAAGHSNAVANIFARNDYNIG